MSIGGKDYPMTWCDGRLPLFVFNIKKIMTDKYNDALLSLNAALNLVKELREENRRSLTLALDSVKELREENKKLKEIIKYAQVLLDLDRALAEDNNNIINAE